MIIIKLIVLSFYARNIVQVLFVFCLFVFVCLLVCFLLLFFVIVCVCVCVCVYISLKRNILYHAAG